MEINDDMQATELKRKLAAVASRWQLEVHPPFANLSINYVTPVTLADGTNAVLKLGVPCREINTEIEALRVYGGRGAVRLLECDEKLGALLLERILPGTPLTQLAQDGTDDDATLIACDVMEALWRPVPEKHSFPKVEEWASGITKLREKFQGGTGPLPVKLVEIAEAYFAELLTTADAQVLLHGDLHHDNILEAGEGNWRAIDPKGLVGEPAYEVGAILRNLWQDRNSITHPVKLLDRRTDIFADRLGFDRARIRGWAISQAVLSAWWCVEDDCDPGWALTMAELLTSTRD